MRLTKGRTATLVIAGLSVALLMALFSPLASAEPDGLERVAEDEEFSDKAKDPPYEIIADYVFPWVGNEDAATILGGVSGVLIVAGIGFGAAFALQRTGRSRSLSRRSPPADGDSLS